MRKLWMVFAVAAAISNGAARAETYTLTLKQAVDRAMAQNPDTMMARLDQLKAEQGIRVAKGPFTPTVGVGSGLAYANGFPLSIEGSAPAAFEAKATQDLFNRSQHYTILQAKENARGATIATAEKNDEIAFRVASLYIDALRASKLAESADREIESLGRVYEATQTRVEAGRELPITAQQANVNLLRARQRKASLDTDRDYAERSLAATLGYSVNDLVMPVGGDAEFVPPPVPANEDAAVQSALASSKELQRLQSNSVAKDLEVRSDKAQRLIRVDLVAQYALLTKYSHYDEYFAKFQRNNGEIGASIQMPIWVSGAVKAAINQAQTDKLHISAEVEAARSRIALEIHQSYGDVAKSALALQVAQADLDLARAQLSVLLAQMNEGRASMSQIEQARFTEDEKWIALYDAQYTAEKARLNVLRETGDLRAALQ